MPPTDRRECPDLIPARPADDWPDGDPRARYRTDGTVWDCEFGGEQPLGPDGEVRRPVTVLARWLDRLGRPVVQVQWSAAGSLWTASYRLDREKIRRG